MEQTWRINWKNLRNLKIYKILYFYWLRFLWCASDWDGPKITSLGVSWSGNEKDFTVLFLLTKMLKRQSENDWTNIDLIN